MLRVWVNAVALLLSKANYLLVTYPTADDRRRSQGFLSRQTLLDRIRIRTSDPTNMERARYHYVVSGRCEIGYRRKIIKTKRCGYN